MRTLSIHDIGYYASVGVEKPGGFRAGTYLAQVLGRPNLVLGQGQCVPTPVSVEKVPQLMLVAVQGSGYKQARVLDAAVHHYIWRPAAYDGTPFPRGVAVLILTARRSGS
jgi:hypothetical protein